MVILAFLGYYLCSHHMMHGFVEDLMVAFFVRCLHAMSRVADLWYIPSPSPVLTVDLSPTSPGSNLFSPTFSTRVGVNNVSLPWQRMVELNFSIVSASGYV